ncbi:TetR family transcriptional regulator [Modestobacter sp. I12A-02628]|uniref:TetR/AcrR family transcriptional regulator n=1 Tax=Goekera deserti TaxID=2497753 RepID=A0A7K3WCD8_9ACTN|nr:TetR/AcrR family transcriptional regulator [Goekera deserti]MPQ98410.1 TetR family transcriptional regulator [Goekera deserti]NDI48237.1 TetR family transcriptional regulator [Goekera deserti]NEL53986.1 TetR/AcrR family transcriptional regulator [Goekera deserti]
MARPRDPAVDRAVVEACVELLDEVGRAGLSRAAIAQRAGVGAPTLNRRFGSVEEVLVAVASSRPAQPPLPADVDSLRGHLVAQLTRTARAFAAGGVRRPAAELLAAAAGDDRVQQALQETLAEVRAEGLRWVERARAAGEVRADVDGETVLDLVTGAAYYRLLWRGEVLTEDEVEPLVDAVLRGLR